MTDRPHAVTRRLVPVDLDVGEHVLLGEGVAGEAQPQALAHRAVGLVGAHQEGGALDALPVGGPQASGDALGVLLEPDQLHRALHRGPVAGELGGQQALGDVLGQGHEPERHVQGQVQVHPRDEGAVDVDELTPHRDSLVERVSEQAAALPHLQGAGLHTNGLGVLRRDGQPVDHPNAHPVADELGGRREPDRSGSDDEHVAVHPWPPSAFLANGTLVCGRSGLSPGPC